jgi:hypothetical protein
MDRQARCFGGRAWTSIRGAHHRGMGSGHACGLTLNAEEKAALVAFLKNFYVALTTSVWHHTAEKLKLLTANCSGMNRSSGDSSVSFSRETLIAISQQLATLTKHSSRRLAIAERARLDSLSERPLYQGAGQASQDGQLPQPISVQGSSRPPGDLARMGL